MCVIAFGYKDTISNHCDLEMVLTDMACTNPDGFGAIIKHKGSDPEVVYENDPFLLASDLHFIDSLYSADSFALHFRLATHGKLSLENLHPFNIQESTWLMHNGIISGLGNERFSDTYELAEILSELPIFKREQLLHCMEASGNGKYLVTTYDETNDSMQYQTFGEFEKFEGLFCSNTYWAFESMQPSYQEYEFYPEPFTRTRTKPRKKKKQTKIIRRKNVTTRTNNS